MKPIIVSNRLPIKLEKIEGKWQILPGSGGLVTALAPVLRGSKSTWVGWPGAAWSDKLNKLLEQSTADIGYRLQRVDLTDKDIAGFYRGFSNESVWPLFHDLLDHCDFETRHWETYQKVNYKFAVEAARAVTEEDFIWVQDYHLM
ncbi:MAG: trehalose-6-phosphate synthase, partial [Candidatus Zixiibacteriota bacterium]